MRVLCMAMAALAEQHCRGRALTEAAGTGGGIAWDLWRSCVAVVW